MAESSEFSESGNPVYRHGERKKPFEFAVGDSKNIELITDHITRHIGPVEWVYHELISDLVHIDVHFVAPTAERNFYTLITTGMSDRPMQVPENCVNLRRAELMICLPPDWKVQQEDFKDERNYWPVRMLKFLARFPHAYNTWLGFGHTIPNGDPAEKISDTDFTGLLIVPPLTVSKDFWEINLPDGEKIHFYAALPVFREEMDFKLKKGADALLEKFDKHGVNELLNVRRKNTAKKLFGLF